MASETSALDLGGLCGKPEFDDSGDRDRRQAGGIMGLIGASHAAAACVAAGEGIEVEPRLGAGVTDRLQAAAALGACDWRSTTVANGDEKADLGLGGVDHLGSRLL